MRPIRLGLEGLRSFHTDPPTVIDFGDRDQIAIIGDTGAGKSSLLEGITYALYGQTSFSGQANQELMNDTAAYLRVKFRFWANDYVWEAVRTLTRKKNGDVGPATAMLERYGDADETLENIEGVKEVNRRITDLLGLDVNAFLRTIVLPQGRFSRLLSEDEPRNRSQILRQIWRTDDLDSAAATTTEALTDIRSLRERVETDRDHYPDEPQAHFDALEKEANEAAAAGDTATAEANAYTQQAEAAAAARTTRERIERALDSAVKARPEAAKVHELSKVQQQLETQENQARQGERRAKENAESNPAPKNGERHQAQIRIDAVAEARAAAVEHRDRTIEVQDAIESVKRTNKDLDEAEAALAEAKAAAQESGGVELIEAHEKVLARNRDALGRISEQYDRYVYQIREPATQARAAVRVHENEAEQALVNANEAATRLLTAEAAAKEAGDRLRAAQQHEASAHAAEDCTSGDDCPVCGQTIPEGWSAPKGSESVAAAREATRTDRDARTARTRAAETKTRAQQATTALIDAERGAQELETEEQAQRRSLLQLLGVEDDVWPEKEAALAPLNEAIATKNAEISQLREASERTRTRLEVTTAAHASARRHQEGATGEATRRRNAASEAAETVQSANGTLAERCSADERKTIQGAANDREQSSWPQLPLTLLDTTEKNARTEAARIDKQAETHAAATSALARAAQTVSRFTDDRRVLVVEPLSEALTTAGRCREQLHDAASTAEAGIAIPGLPLTSDPEQAAKAIEEIAAAADTLAISCRERLERATATEREALESARRMAQAQGIETSGNEADWPKRAAAESARRAETARGAAHNAIARAKEFVEHMEDIEKLQALADRITQTEGQLKELDDGLRPGRFPKWLTLRRSVNLLRHASQRLEEMSERRYAFRDPRDTAEAWKILDRWSGATRSPATLSGGEQFMASLALSLGMVETMGERGGRLECFFLDEGFGTLDSRTLEEALDALDRAATADHMVGVITHVRQVAERITAVLLVERDPSRGSRVRWLNENERANAVEDGDLGLNSVN